MVMNTLKVLVQKLLLEIFYRKIIKQLIFWSVFYIFYENWVKNFLIYLLTISLRVLIYMTHRLNINYKSKIKNNEAFFYQKKKRERKQVNQRVNGLTFFFNDVQGTRQAHCHTYILHFELKQVYKIRLWGKKKVYKILCSTFPLFVESIPLYLYNYYVSNSPPFI